jgi:hypothetical protein
MKQNKTKISSTLINRELKGKSPVRLRNYLKFCQLSVDVAPAPPGSY